MTLASVAALLSCVNWGEASSFLRFIFIYVHVVCLCESMSHVYVWYLHRPQEGARFPGVGVQEHGFGDSWKVFSHELTGRSHSPCSHPYTSSLIFTKDEEPFVCA